MDRSRGLTVRVVLTWMGAILSLLFFSALHPVWADPVLRVASFNAGLTRKGPGLLLRDLERGEDPQIAAVVRVIATVAPDILALQSFDWDHEGIALSRFAELLRAAGLDYPYLFAARPNTGLATDLDLDGDGRLGGPGDAQGFGEFTGQEGLAVLSRYPILAEAVQDFGALKWRDFPDALLPQHPDGRPYPSPEAQDAQRLSDKSHWIVPIEVPGIGPVHLLTFHASPPVFDGPEDRNGRRNHDEIVFWQAFLDGAFGPAPEGRFVLAGDANLDPFDSDGRRAAIRGLLQDPRFQDPEPASHGAAEAAGQGHRGANALDTVDWDDPGRMRVDYVLPSRDWRVVDAGVYWPAAGQEGQADALAASRHRLVWVDLAPD